MMRGRPARMLLIGAAAALRPSAAWNMSSSRPFENSSSLAT